MSKERLNPVISKPKEQSAVPLQSETSEAAVNPSSAEQTVEEDQSTTQTSSSEQTAAATHTGEQRWQGQIDFLNGALANIKEVLQRETHVQAEAEYQRLEQLLASHEQVKDLFTASSYAHQAIERDRIAVNADNFPSYSGDMMTRDLLEVEKKKLEIKLRQLREYLLIPAKNKQESEIVEGKKKLQQEILREKVAEVFEFLTYHTINSQDVFADQVDLDGQQHDEEVPANRKARAIPSALYDDYFNGVDCVFKAGGVPDLAKVTAFCIDSTIGVSSANLEKKDFHLQKLATRGELAKIKYLSLGEDFPYVGELRNIPRFTVSIDDGLVMFLAKNYLVPGVVNGDESQVSSEAKKQQENLAAHLLMQLCVQSGVTYLLSDHFLNQHTAADDVDEKTLVSYQQAHLRSKSLWSYFSRALLKKTLAYAKERQLASGAMQTDLKDTNTLPLEPSLLQDMKSYLSSLSPDRASATLIKHYASKIYNMAGKPAADERHPYRGLKIQSSRDSAYEQAKVDFDNVLLEAVLQNGLAYARDTLDQFNQVRANRAPSTRQGATS